jgi:hypothetical protein
MLAFIKDELEKELINKKLEIKKVTSEIRLSSANRQKISGELNELRTQRDKLVGHLFLVLKISVLNR